MRVGLITREYPPEVYGGAGVHVEYLSRELAKLIEVEVHCWGTQRADEGNLHVRGNVPPPEVTAGSDAKFKTAVEALALNLTQMKELAAIDVVHTHTWYASMAGFLAKKLYKIPFVLTTHSLEPLRAWKAEQLGSGYAMSSWMERTAILDADAIIAVSHGTKADILRAYPEVDAAARTCCGSGQDCGPAATSICAACGNTDGLQKTRQLEYNSPTPVGLK